MNHDINVLFLRELLHRTHSGKIDIAFRLSHGIRIEVAEVPSFE